MHPTGAESRLKQIQYKAQHDEIPRITDLSLLRFLTFCYDDVLFCSLHDAYQFLLLA
jgi:hypothetical protein